MTIVPEGENIRRAVKWISNQRADGSDIPLHALVDQASLTFNLTPAEADYLSRFFCQGGDDPS